MILTAKNPSRTDQTFDDNDGGNDGGCASEKKKKKNSVPL